MLAIRDLVANWNTQTEVRRIRCVARGWSRIETPCVVLQHRIWEIADEYEAMFRRHETLCHETLARLCIVNATCAVRSCVNHPFQRCPVYECIELQIFYSVNTGDVTNELHQLDRKTWLVNVTISCLHRFFQKSVWLNVVQHVLYFVNQVVSTSSLLCSPPPSP